MRRAYHTSRSAAAGLSLIEVLIALLVLGFGLLGLAFLQTMNLRYTQSANQRTQAVNLAGELLDMMRSNRSQLASYAMEQDMSSVPEPTDGCETETDLGAANNVERWKCEVREALGADASAKVVTDAGTGLVSVRLRWNEDNLASGITGANTVELTSRL